MKMKLLMLSILVIGLGAIAATLVVNSQQTARRTHEMLLSERGSWEAEKADLEAALDKARARRPVEVPLAAPQTPAAPAVVAPDATEILNQLIALQGPVGQGRATRQLLLLLEQLAQIGPPALPAIQQFLATGKDVVYDANLTKGMRDAKVLTDALVPATLRLALLDVIRQIGGPEAERILAVTLGSSGRGLEVAYVTQLLEEMAPGKYREIALVAARGLLSRGTLTERDYLYAVLRRFNDTSFVSAAQAQLVAADGKVDVGALRYLQQAMGDQSVAIAAEAYKNGQFSDGPSKEPLARLALAYVGANAQAAELFHTAITDEQLTAHQHKELVEDLNQDGLSNKKTPTPADLELIANRYALTQAYLQQDYVQNDKVLNEAFREADKDLRNLLQRAAAAAANPVGATTPR